MKIGILTFTNGTNLGQRLQNYALQETLKKYADEVYTIEQTEPYSAKHLIKMRVKRIVLDLKDPSKSRAKKEREKCFKKFNDKNIQFYQRKLLFNGDNTWISKEFDAFIVGSDQVWNPNSPYVGDNFFLTFANSEQRFTYAPSFSVEEIPFELKEKYRQRLQGLNTISVREDKGAEIVYDLIGKQSVVVADPTMLLNRDDWNQIKEEFPRQIYDGYALQVFLGTTSLSDDDEIRGVIGKEIIIDNDSMLSPAQFLDLIEHAKIVLTDSYHVSVFAAIYHIPFINFERKGTKNNMNSRFQTLYRMLNIGDRSWSVLKGNTTQIFEVDFDAIDQSLENERKKSFEYLDKTIGRLNNKNRL